MSVITLQIGQCGNQIGQKLYSTIYDDINSSTTKTSSSAYKNYNSEAVSRWFNLNKHRKLEARSVAIDTEQKVIQNTFLGYKFTSVLSKSYGGCANNWAYGYSSENGAFLNEIINEVRKQVEKCDCVGAFLGIFSSSGGTGSGLGTRITEFVQSEYPNKTLINALVLPYKSGEVVTQNFNTLLTLSKLFYASDMLIIFENDGVHDVCKKAHLSKIDYADLNAVISQQISSVFQPATALKIPNLVSDLCSNSSYKCVQVKSVPHLNPEFSKYEPLKTWTTLAKTLNKQVNHGLNMTEKDHRKCQGKSKSCGTVLISRGVDLPNSKDLKTFSDDCVFRSSDLELKYYYCLRRFSDNERFLTSVSNSSSICGTLDHVLQDSWDLFTHGAYLHNYKKFGVDEQCFLHAFERVETVLCNYKSL